MTLGLDSLRKPGSVSEPVHFKAPVWLWKERERLHDDVEMRNATRGTIRTITSRLY